MYLIWLSIFGNGYGRFGNIATNGAVNAAANAIGRAELADGLNNQTVLNELRTLGTSVKDVYANSQAVGSDISKQICSSFGNSNMSMMGGFNNLGNSITMNSNGIINAINTAAANQQIANCNLFHAIQDNKYEMAQNTCAITNAVHEEGEATRKAMVDQTIQNLRDQKEAVQRDLQSAQLTLSNANQTQNILNTLGRFVPYAGCGYSCGCGSTVNNGF